MAPRLSRANSGSGASSSRAGALALAAALSALVGAAIAGPGAVSVHAQTVSRRAPGYAIEENVDWGFSHRERRVKAVLLAGSIGAFQRSPYARLLHERCQNAEVRNLSKVAAGSYELMRRFRERVLENRRIPRGDTENEYWLIFQGGLNSAGGPHRTNRYIRELFMLAHQHRFRVLGLSLTPWGSTRDHRWRGIEALHSLRNTRRIVDFVMGRLTPRDALGRHAEGRSVPADAPWTAEELPDVSVDLFDSPLRHHTAALEDEATSRRILERDHQHRELLAALPEARRSERMQRDLSALVQVRRWHMDPRYRSFDDVHPNEEGHRLIADRICPQLPPSWGCQCGAAAPAAGSSAGSEGADAEASEGEAP